eukprot:gene16630-22877_t
MSREDLRKAHNGQFPNVLESDRFAIKWGDDGNFNADAGTKLLELLERFWAVMTGSELGFSQERGWVKEKRGTHRMNVYVTDTGLQAPGTGSYLECDPEGVHYISTPNNVYMMAHELGHLAEMGTYFYKDNPDGIRLYLERHMMPLDDFETRSTAAQDELPFEVIQRLMGPSTLFANLFCDFASRTVAYDFDTLGAKLRNMNGDSNGRTRMDSVTSLGDGRTFISREDSELCWFGFEVLDVRALLAHVQSSAAEVNDESRRKGQQNVVEEDREVLLVVCATGRHDDAREPPSYTITIELAPSDWECQFYGAASSPSNV